MAILKICTLNHNTWQPNERTFRILTYVVNNTIIIQQAPIYLLGIGRVHVVAAYESNMAIESYTYTNRVSHPVTPIPDWFLNFRLKS